MIPYKSTDIWYGAEQGHHVAKVSINCFNSFFVTSTHSALICSSRIADGRASAAATSPLLVPALGTCDAFTVASIHWEVRVAPHSFFLNLETIMSRERRGCAG